MMRNVLSAFDSPYGRFCKWSCMSAGVLWMVIYMLSESAAKWPDFVYVNF